MGKKLYIIANWKSNKTQAESISWTAQVSSIKYDVLSIENKEIIICPPFTLLSDIKSYILDNKLFIKVGAQDISPFDEGPYTGAINGKQIKEFADYVIIGHSERRSNFLENDDMLVKKVEMAKKYGINPIFCVQDEKIQVPNGVEITAYEPMFAIGTGNPDTPENADKVADEIKKKNKAVKYVLYGGSVTSENVSSFTQMSNIDGVLVGGASLDANEFIKIIENA